MPRHFWGLVILALVARYACHSLMLLVVLVHERTPAPSLPDLILSYVPYVESLARWNYTLWILCYIPGAVYIGWRDRSLFLRLVVLDGILALVRGLCIPLTALGPVLGSDLNALQGFPFWSTWLSIVNPISAVVGNTAGIYLTKDLFFSGHIATTFLLYLFSRRLGRVSWIFLGLNLFTLAIVFLAHLHYTIDVVGAYAITYCLYRAGVKVGWVPRDVCD
ncbi:phosphatase PAP2-related protein [Holophaga foetida]|uniref:phosphatase PAP2-related protein n=1 Tax=Holophaga foetida TaxID=35839 RepID=UPI0006971BC3|nr:phosphatase PAP2-related protein [Holophaga foetida]